MTSASELFYTRRSRFDRNSFELRLDSPPDRISHHNHNQNRRNLSHGNTGRRDRTDSDNCDPLRRNSRALHRLPFPDRESIRVEQSSSQSGSNSNNNSSIISPENIRSSRNRQNFSTNNSDRLPGSVLLARERLLHRLRGLSSTNRQRNRVSSSSNDDDLTSFGVSNRVLDPEDHDIINTRTDMLLASSSLQETRKRPCGINEEVFKSLNVDIFMNKGETEECSVCLESFVEGEKILSLSCRHSFHSCCLEPWVRICSDCPNCRTCI